MTDAFIGLGSNLGDCVGHLVNARAEIMALCGTRHVRSSPIYRTEPVGVPDCYKDHWFFNAVAWFKTGLSVEAWSAELHALEERMSRVRGERNAPRTIDIDLLTYGDVIVSRPDLTLPHPQCHQRRFVCQPFADICPDFILPGQMKTMGEILKTLPHKPIVESYNDERWRF
jgi:2-amino-4-hydroxy-6-hydroxymethyldihydropteridine diphosphokinase